MGNLKSFEDLKVWQKAHELVLKIYQITENFPNEERYGLISQMRRAAFSIPANIVEGFRRVGAKDSLHFYNIASASLEELRYEVRLSFDLGYLDKKETSVLNDMAQEVSKMLFAWIQSQKQNFK